jgi:hypothetical protein
MNVFSVTVYAIILRVYRPNAPCLCMYVLIYFKVYIKSSCALHNFQWPTSNSV